MARLPQASPFCPNIAATPDGAQVWFTLKDTGKTQVFDARPPFGQLKLLDTGPISNHVNIVRNAHGQFAYVTVGGLNEVQVFRTSDFGKVATIKVGKLPHSVWPSGDGSRVYVGLENDDAMAAIDTLTNTVLASVPIGQAPQAVVYVPAAVPEGAGTQGLTPLGVAGQAYHLTMIGPGETTTGSAPTSVSLFDQGLIQVLEASVTGLMPGHPYVLAFSDHADGSRLDALATFMTNPAGAAIVNAIGPIRQIVRGNADQPKRYLVIAPGDGSAPTAPAQIQAA